MIVHIISHFWDDEETSGCESWGAFFDKDKARKRMSDLAYEEKDAIQENRNCVYDSDFCQDDEDLISFGWYGEGCRPDCIFRWEIFSEEVE